MRKNVEIKAYCEAPEEMAAKIAAMGAVFEGERSYSDTYFRTYEGRLKLRQWDDAARLLFYRRLSTPVIRESDFISAPQADDHPETVEILTQALGVQNCVNLVRQTWRHEDMEIHLDCVEGVAHFIALYQEVDVRDPIEKGEAPVALLIDALGIGQQDILPWSYADWFSMVKASRRWRKVLAQAEQPGTLYLLDGASCSGKTSLTEHLQADRGLNLSFIPRYCTRDPRSGEEHGSEYIFVNAREFTEAAASGTFIEFRDYEFGMSYGFPWEQAINTLVQGRNAFGVMNLGNVAHVKRLFPEARTVLIHAPLETIRQRLTDRGMNLPHQIEERVGNARTVEAYRDHYHHVIENDNGMLETAEAQLVDLVRE